MCRTPPPRMNVETIGAPQDAQAHLKQGRAGDAPGAGTREIDLDGPGEVPRIAREPHAALHRAPHRARQLPRAEVLGRAVPLLHADRP